MKKSFLLGFLLLLFAFAVTALAAQPEVPPDGLKMDKVKKVVIFNHSTHKENKCVECHHLVNGQEDFQKCSAAGCHDNLDQKDKSEKSFYQAMHKAKEPKHISCISCHAKAAGDDAAKKKELTACAKSKCHP